MFQFHTGSIKRSYYDAKGMGIPLSFNSILVRLKVYYVAPPLFQKFIVSIPYWFD